MVSTFVIMILYGSLAIWCLAPQKPPKPKTPEEQLGEALTKYLSSLDIPKKS